MRWLRSVTRITYLSQLIGTPSLAAFLQPELFWGFVLVKRMAHFTDQQPQCG
ncbi:hypothetical protein EC840_108139 [Rahnella sp. JUb53]|nr:hypothetical protein EC840_108139 [Rahnella sp. JUb53]